MGRRRATRSAEEVKLRSYIKRHAPPGWQKLVPFEEVRRRTKRVKYAEPVQTVVLCADIVASTRLFECTQRPELIVNNLRVLFKELAGVVHAHGGWFDKFMGDGFLAYWPVVSGKRHEAIRRTMAVIREAKEAFGKKAVYLHGNAPGARHETVGMCFGLAIGPAYWTVVAEDLTILGMPVVTATRMQQDASAGETLCCQDVAALLPESHPSLVGKVERQAELTRKRPKVPKFRVVFRRGEG